MRLLLPLRMSAESLVMTMQNCSCGTQETGATAVR